MAIPEDQITTEDKLAAIALLERPDHPIENEEWVKPYIEEMGKLVAEKRRMKTNKPQKASTQGWFGGWFGGSSADSEAKSSLAENPALVKINERQAFLKREYQEISLKRERAVKEATEKAQKKLESAGYKKLSELEQASYLKALTDIEFKYFLEHEDEFYVSDEDLEEEEEQLFKGLSEKIAARVAEKLTEQDNNVKDAFAVDVRVELAKKQAITDSDTSKFSSSLPIKIGAAMLIPFFVQLSIVGSIAAVGAFPIGLAVVGAVILIGAGLFYAYKKRARIARFLPALYEKAKNLRTMRISALENTEKVKKLETLERKLKERESENIEATKEIIRKQEDKTKLIVDEIEGDILWYKARIRNIDLILAQEDNAQLSSEHELEIKKILNKSNLKSLSFSGDIKPMLRTIKNDLEMVKLPEIERVKDKKLMELAAFKEKQKELLETKKAKAKAEFKMDSRPLETKSGLKWYKKIAPYLEYIVTVVAINFKAITLSAAEFNGVIKEGVNQINAGVQAKTGSAAAPIAFQKYMPKFPVEAEQISQRITSIIGVLELPGDTKTDFGDYLAIEQCYSTEEIFRLKIEQLTLGGTVKNLILQILYTHPSTVLTLLAKNSEVTKDNMLKILDAVTEKLDSIPSDLSCMNTLEIYFPSTNNPDNARFMFVANKDQGHVALFENILLIKQGIMEVNKTLSALTAEELASVKLDITRKIAPLIENAGNALKAIEAQFVNLEIEEEANNIRAAYFFSDFQQNQDLKIYIGKTNLSNLILWMDKEYLGSFANALQQERSVQPISGVLKEFIALYGNENWTKVDDNQKLKFFQKVANAEKEDPKQFDKVKRYHAAYVRGDAGLEIQYNKLRKLNGDFVEDEGDFLSYIKNNQHIYYSQEKLIAQKRSVLEEMQKALVLSIPEIAETLELDKDSQQLKGYLALCKDSRVDSYGVPYNPARSISLGYVKNLFKSARDVISKVVKLTKNFKGFNDNTMTISSFKTSLDDMIELVGNKSIPGSVESANKVLAELEKSATFKKLLDSVFGSQYTKMKAMSEIFSKENQAKIVAKLQTLRTFLDKIPAEFGDSSFKLLVDQVKNMAKEILALKLQLTQLQKGFNPADPQKARALEEILGELNTLQSKFDTFKDLIESETLSELFKDLPGAFPGKKKLSEYVGLFEKTVKGDLNKINENLQAAMVITKLIPVVNVIKAINPSEFQEELASFLERGERLANEVKGLNPLDGFIENAKEKLLELGGVKARLLELQKLIELSSEIANIDFTKPPYASVLVSLGLGKEKVDSVVEKLKDASSVVIGNSLNALGAAEIPIKLSLLLENVQVAFLHSNLDSEEVDYVEFFNAIKDAKKIYNELLSLSSDGGGVLKTSLSEMNKHFSDLFDEAMRYTKSMGDQMVGVAASLVGADKTLLESLTSKNAMLISKFEDYNKMIKILEKYKSNLKFDINNDVSLKELMALNSGVFDLERDVLEFSKLKEEVKMKLSKKEPEISGMKEFLGVLDQFYGLNTQEEIRQNLEFAKSILPDNTQPLIFGGPGTAAEEKAPSKRKRPGPQSKHQ